jgi:hypothetical protein
MNLYGNKNGNYIELDISNIELEFTRNSPLFNDWGEFLGETSYTISLEKNSINDNFFGYENMYEVDLTNSKYEGFMKIAMMQFPVRIELVEISDTYDILILLTPSSLYRKLSEIKFGDLEFDTFEFWHNDRKKMTLDTDKYCFPQFKIVANDTTHQVNYKMRSSRLMHTVKNLINVIFKKLNVEVEFENDIPNDLILVYPYHKGTLSEEFPTGLYLEWHDTDYQCYLSPGEFLNSKDKCSNFIKSVCQILGFVFIPTDDGISFKSLKSIYYNNDYKLFPGHISKFTKRKDEKKYDDIIVKSTFEYDYEKENKNYYTADKCCTVDISNGSFNKDVPLEISDESESYMFAFLDKLQYNYSLKKMKDMGNYEYWDLIPRFASYNEYSPFFKYMYGEKQEYSFEGSISPLNFFRMDLTKKYWFKGRIFYIKEISIKGNSSDALYEISGTFSILNN